MTATTTAQFNSTFAQSVLSAFQERYQTAPAHLRSNVRVRAEYFFNALLVRVSDAFGEEVEYSLECDRAEANAIKFYVGG